MKSHPINMFFLGKGGVGKSTLSALSALYLAEKGNRVYLVSMDPAHNQADIFQKKISQKPMKVDNNLLISEINLNELVKNYLKQVEDNINNAYRYLTAFNLEQYTTIIKYSPGIEEYALLLGFNDIVSQFTANYFIFDMPPTALAVKFFNLPSLSMLWLEKLMQLRHEIIKKRQIITKVKFGKKETETDKVLQQLTTQKEFYNRIQNTFQNENTTFVNIVVNPDELSYSESQDIISSLRNINVKPKDIIINKFIKSEHIEKSDARFAHLPIQYFTQMNYPLIGIDTLKRCLHENYDHFSFL